MQLKIWHKMIIGISIPSFIAFFGGLLSYKYLNDVKGRQVFVQIADNLKDEALEVRRNEKNFLLHKDEEYHKYCQDAIHAFNNSVNSISSEIVKEIGKEDFSLLGNSIQKYSVVVYNLLGNYQQEAEVIEHVRTEGRKLETVVASKKHAEYPSTDFILNLRRLEKNYMLFRDKSSLIKLNDVLSQLNTVPACVECVRYSGSMRNLFEIYEQSDSMVNDLQEIGNRLETITNRIANGERQKVNSFIALTQSHLLIALLLLVTLGPLFVYKTATYIVAPIKRLAEITRKISGGDLTLRAPIREHDETYSLALSFNTMLDHLQLTHESLERSLELLQEKQTQLVESQKRASLGLLISGVAHELNNPLNNISLTAEAMKEDLNELSREELEEYIQDIFIQSERAQNIVENLLDFARARRSAVMEKQDIVRIVKESFNLVANQMRINSINLVQDLPDRPYYVKGNRSKLEQVLISIMTNAIQAMDANGTLTVSVRPDSEDKNILIKITDTGQGISAANLKHIFEPFFTTKSPGEGTGLGLSVCRSLVTEHKGEIEAESTEGSGTTFTVRLPQYDEAIRSET
jgi:two-component system NtrC family sensor kinase